MGHDQKALQYDGSEAVGAVFHAMVCEDLQVVIIPARLGDVPVPVIAETDGESIRPLAIGLTDLLSFHLAHMDGRTLFEDEVQG